MKKFVLILTICVVFLTYMLTKEDSFSFHKPLILSNKSTHDKLKDSGDEQTLEKGDPVMSVKHILNFQFVESQTKSINQTERSGNLKKRFPQAIIAGVKKCGTRALLSFLAKHPHVRSAGKEMHFFDKDDNYNKGLDYYLAEMPFSHENQVTIEKTPGYFINPNAPERIYNLSPFIKLIFIFRDPVERAISDFAQTLAKSADEVKEIEKRIFIDGSIPKKININSSLIKIGLYAEHLQRWLKFFPMKQMYFANGDEFIKNPALEMKEIQKFLNIPLVINKSSFVYNQTKGFYCLRVEKEEEGCLGETKGRKHPYVKKSTKIKMLKFFKSYNKQFFSIINKNFGWVS
ncbi:heparan sulfate glucosamine 3-O-sulfotransferase 1 isoform X2 [Hydra vulgaris]|uniref:Heparan sulfate glucosamine 3-O-sulfotransferase 1 isoform X2 n=1 Tax=Hydra vulgaris TaxID=6087 RepID=A0ABM4BFU8_HYDVU